MPITIRNGSVKLFKHKIKDVATGKEVKVSYWESKKFRDMENQDFSLVKGITISQKDYGYDLSSIFPNAKNATDIMTDYFEHSSVFITEDDADYSAIVKMMQEYGKI